MNEERMITLSWYFGTVYLTVVSRNGIYLSNKGYKFAKKTKTKSSILSPSEKHALFKIETAQKTYF